VSISADLKVDAERDLADCGIGEDVVQVVALNKCPYGKLKLGGSTVLFATYSSLVAKRHGASGNNFSSRLDQIVAWLGADFEGCVVFDECHKSKNLIPSAGGTASRTGTAVVELQQRVPKARVLYCSATGASEPRNMGYMVRHLPCMAGTWRTRALNRVRVHRCALGCGGRARAIPPGSRTFCPPLSGGGSVQWSSSRWR
jgi:hypothetical protein